VQGAEMSRAPIMGSILEHSSAQYHMHAGFGFAVNVYTAYRGAPMTSQYSIVNETLNPWRKGRNMPSLTKDLKPSYVVRVWPK
jgi:hypothetical protein